LVPPDPDVGNVARAGAFADLARILFERRDRNVHAPGAIPHHTREPHGHRRAGHLWTAAHRLDRLRHARNVAEVRRRSTRAPTLRHLECRSAYDRWTGSVAIDDRQRPLAPIAD